MSLRIGGLGSGMDTQMMLEQLMRAERMPLDRLKQQRQVLQWKQEDYRTINRKLESFERTAFNMRLSSTYNVRSVNSSNTNAVTATASGSAASGTYTVNVDRLATKAFANSTATLDMAEGITDTFTREVEVDGELVSQTMEFKDFTLNGVQFTFNQEVAADGEFEGVFINPSSSTLASVIADINNSNAGVHMFYDATENKVFMSSKETGQAITIEGEENNFLNSILKFDVSSSSHDYQPGETARVRINGYLLENRPNNTITFGGVTFNLKEANTTSTVTVAKDNDKVFNNIKDFIDQYNALVGAMNEKLVEPRNRDYPPLTDEQKEQLSDREAEKWEKIAREGHLRNDTLLQSVLNDMRSTLGGSIEGLDIKSLSQIGITTGSYHERGILHIDEQKLRDAIADNPDGVYRLFAGGIDGNGERIEVLSAKLTRSINNSIRRLGNEAGRTANATDQSFIGRNIKRIDDRIFSFEDRLQRVEDRYWRQFTAMEKAMDQMYNQSQWLNQQLMGMF